MHHTPDDVAREECTEQRAEEKQETPLSDLVDFGRPSTPPPNKDTFNSNYSQRKTSDEHRDARARGHHFESKQLSDVPVLSQVAYDDEGYTLTAFLGDAYDDDSQWDPMEQSDSESPSLCDTEEEILEAMLSSKERANSSTIAQNLIESLLSFSVENMANHVEMHSPREEEM